MPDPTLDACLDLPPTAQLDQFLAMTAGGMTYYREPYPDTRDDPTVFRSHVSRRRPNLYRAVILYRTLQPGGNYLHVCESSRELVTHWLTEHGLPTVRLIRSDF